MVTLCIIIHLERMKNSLFLDELREPFTVSLLTIEYHASIISDDMSDEQIMESFFKTLKFTCGVESPEQSHVEFLLAKFEAIKQESDQPQQPPRGRSLGSSFFDYLGKLDTVKLLGLMTNYDIDKMRKLYCHTDFMQVKELITAYTEFLREQQIVNFEATMYGMGNSYKDDASSGGGKAIDANSKEGRAMMRKFGVGDVTPEHLDQLGINLDFSLPGAGSSGPVRPS